jgi:hypothetical protein
MMRAGWGVTGEVIIRSHQIRPGGGSHLMTDDESDPPDD